MEKKTIPNPLVHTDRGLEKHLVLVGVSTRLQDLIVSGGRSPELYSTQFYTTLNKKE